MDFSPTDCCRRRPRIRQGVVRSGQPWRIWIPFNSAAMLVVFLLLCLTKISLMWIKGSVWQLDVDIPRRRGDWSGIDLRHLCASTIGRIQSVSVCDAKLWLLHVHAESSVNQMKTSKMRWLWHWTSMTHFKCLLVSLNQDMLAHLKMGNGLGIICSCKI